jgi:hypothetical protein
MAGKLYEELHEELTQELTEERYKELQRKTQRLFFDLFFIGTNIDNNPNLDNRGFKRSFFRLLTTSKDFEYLVRDSPARTLGPPNEREMMIFKSYFDDRIDMNTTYKQFDLNEGIVKFLVNNLGLNGAETQHLWEIIYYNLRVVEENKRKMDEEDRKRLARFDDTPVVPLSRKQPQTPKEDEMPDYVAPKTKARDRTNPPPFPPPAPGDAPAPGRLPWIPGVGNAQAQRAYNNFPWDESGGRRRKSRKSRKPRKSSNKKRKQRKTKRRRQ